MACSAHCLALSLALAITATPVGVAARASEAATSRNPVAVDAYQRATALVHDRDYAEAVAQLDVASDLEPTWADPVRLRAEVFATLAEKHRPSETFLAARADDLQRLQAIDAASAPSPEIAALRQGSKDAGEIERRRRKLITPALILGSVAACVTIGGLLLLVMTPREFLQPTAYRQYRRTRAGITLMAAGGALLVPTVVLGVLAGRQARNDSATRAFAVHTGRQRPIASLAPQFLPRGGGMGLHLRF